MAIKKIGVLTSGGDAPGMNAAIRAAVRRGLQKGVQMKGILKGYDGLMNEEIIDMTARDVSDTIERGGTIVEHRLCPDWASTPSAFPEPSTWISPAQNIPSVLIPR